MQHFQIAGMNISVLWENEDKKMKYYRYHDCIILPRSLAAFHREEMQDDTDMKVVVHSLREQEGSNLYKKLYNQSFYRKADNMIMTMYDPYDNEIPGYSITMSADYSQIEYTPHIREYENYSLQWLMYPFEGRVLYKGGIVLHGAAVEYNGKGIIFTGISGAGKSTQAHLWQKYKDAFIINGDCPVINMEEGVTKVYGTPWCGTSGEYINKKVTLNAIVLVKKGDKNMIREIKGHTAFLAILANTLRSNFDDCTLDLAVINLKRIVGQVRVYELTCTISEEAVNRLEEQLSNISSCYG